MIIKIRRLQLQFNQIPPWCNTFRLMFPETVILTGRIKKNQLRLTQVYLRRYKRLVQSFLSIHQTLVTLESGRPNPTRMDTSIVGGQFPHNLGPLGLYAFGSPGLGFHASRAFDFSLPVSSASSGPFSPDGFLGKSSQLSDVSSSCGSSMSKAKASPSGDSMLGMYFQF